MLFLLFVPRWEHVQWIWVMRISMYGVISGKWCMAGNSGSWSKNTNSTFICRLWWTEILYLGNIKKKSLETQNILLFYYFTSKINQGLIWIRTCRVLCLPSIFAAFNEHCSRKLDLYSTVERAVSDSLNWARCVTRKTKPLCEKEKYRFALGLSCSILHECTIKTITKKNLIVVARLSFMWDFDFMFNFCNDSSWNG